MTSVLSHAQKEEPPRLSGHLFDQKYAESPRAGWTSVLSRVQKAKIPPLRGLLFSSKRIDLLIGFDVRSFPTAKVETRLSFGHFFLIENTPISNGG